VDYSKVAMKKLNRLSKLSLSLMQGSLVCHPQS
jgi:hypothetical protein